MPSSIGRDMALRRSGRFMVSTATPSVTVSSRSLLIGGSSGLESLPLLRRGKGAQIRDQRADLVVGQMIAEGGHAGLADGRAAIRDETEEVLVRKVRHVPAVGQVARPDQEEGGAPRARAGGAVAGRAVGQVEPLD